MVLFACIIACWLNILGLLYLAPPDLWFYNGYRALDYVQNSSELQLDLLEDPGGQPDVLEIVPEESSFVVAPSTRPDLFATVPEANALVVWTPSTRPDFLEIVSKENPLVVTPSTALSLLHRSEDDHSLTLILLVLLSVPVALLVYKVYLLVRRTFAKRPCEESPDSAHEDDHDVADEDSGNSSLKLPPSDSGTDLHDTEKGDEVVSLQSPMMTVLPQSIEDSTNDKEDEGVIETIDTSQVFKPQDESSLKFSNKETMQDAESFIQFMGKKIPVDDHPEEGTSVTLDVPREKHAFINGRNGRVVKEIHWKAKVDIDMPSPEQTSSAVIIKGNPHSIQKAAKMIEKILKKCHRTKD